MAGGGGPVPKGTFKIVRYVTLSDAQLEQLGDLLGIPEAERADIFSGEIHIVPETTRRFFPGRRKRPKKPKR